MLRYGRRGNVNLFLKQHLHQDMLNNSLISLSSFRRLVHQLGQPPFRHPLRGGALHRHRRRRTVEYRHLGLDEPLLVLVGAALQAPPHHGRAVVHQQRRPLRVVKDGQLGADDAVAHLENIILILIYLCKLEGSQTVSK